MYCIISFSSTFHVISLNFGLLFGQCTVLFPYPVPTPISEACHLSRKSSAHGTSWTERITELSGPGHGLHISFGHQQLQNTSSLNLSHSDTFDKCSYFLCEQWHTAYLFASKTYYHQQMLSESTHALSSRPLPTSIYCTVLYCTVLATHVAYRIKHLMSLLICRNKE